MTTPTTPAQITRPAGSEYLIAIAALIVIGAGLKFAGSIVGPAFLAISLVITARPLGVWMIRRKVPTPLAALTVIGVLVAILVGIVVSLVTSVAALTEELPNYNRQFNSLVQQILSLAQSLNITVPTLQEALSYLEPARIASVAGSVVSSASAAGTQLVILIMVIVFVSFDMAFVRWRSAQLSEQQPYIAGALSDFAHRSRQYWIVATVFGAIVAAIDYAILAIMGIPLAFTWAIFAFVTNYIPNIGFVLGVVPPAILALLAHGWKSAVIVIVLYSVVNFIAQSVIQPKITGDAVGLNPTTTFISLVFWTTIIGPLGSILAVPLTLFAKAILVDANPSTRWMGVFLRAGDKPSRNPFHEDTDPLIELAEYEDSLGKGQRVSDEKLRAAAGGSFAPQVDDHARLDDADAAPHSDDDTVDASDTATKA